MSDSGWGYIFGLGPILIAQKLGLPGMALATVFLAAAGFAGGVAYEKHHSGGDAIAKATVSEGRKQLLDQNLAGSRADFDRYMQEQVSAREKDFQQGLKTLADTYFKQKGLPCDPGQASATVGETLARAQCQGTAPKF